MQPFVGNRKFYEKTLFGSIGKIDAHLQMMGFQADIRELSKAIKTVETPTLELCSIVAGAMYRKIRTQQWQNDLLKETKEQEECGETPHFIIEAESGRHKIHLQRITPTGSGWLKDRPERL